MKTGNTLILKVASSTFRPEQGQLLEIAAVLLGPTGAAIDFYTSIIAAQPTVKIPPFHQQLLDECCAEDAPSLRRVEGELLARGFEFVAVCSRALDFQLEWINLHMPAFARTLRTKVQIELKGLELLSGREWVSPNPRSYRAADDCVDAVEELRSYHVAVSK